MAIGKKTVSVMALALLLTSMLIVSFNIQPARAEGSIYIRTDGSVDPPTAPISSVDNVTYTFTDNIYDSVFVERSNITIDGNGYTLQGSGTYYSKGVWLSGISNVTVRNTTIEAFYYGVYLDWTSCAIISENSIVHNGFDILLNSSSNNRIYENDIRDGGGISLYSYSNNNIISCNKISGGGVTLYWSSANTLSENNITNSMAGFRLHESFDNTIFRNNVIGNTGGVDLSKSSNNTVRENNITSGNWGLLLEDSSCNIIYCNSITNIFYGVRLQSSSYNTLSGNEITNNNYGVGVQISGSSYNTLFGNLINGINTNFAVSGNEPSHFMHSIDVSNLVDGKAVYYLVNHTDSVVNSTTHPQVGFLALVNCANVTVEGLTLRDNGQGLLLAYTNNSRVTENMITNTYVGVSCIVSNNNTIHGNEITKSGGGISLSSSSFNIVSRNNITSSILYYGIGLGTSLNNIISENEVAAKNKYDIYEDGIYLYDSSYNTICGNNIADNNDGVELESSSNNRFYHNDFINNDHQVSLTDSLDNVWDDGYPSGGNFWSEFARADEKSGPYQNQTGGDGIADAPYTINQNNQDAYPLMFPWTPIATQNINITKRGTTYPISVTSNATVLDLKETPGSLKLEASGMTGTSGYVRIIQPIGLNSTNIKVFLNNTRLSFPSYDPPASISANSTHYFIYFTIDFKSSYNTTIWFPMLGDVNADGYVGIDDVFTVAQHYGSETGNPNYNPYCDLSEDNYVGIDDIFTAAQHFGEQENP